jgi:hypothetical protein
MANEIDLEENGKAFASLVADVGSKLMEVVRKEDKLDLSARELAAKHFKSIAEVIREIAEKMDTDPIKHRHVISVACGRLRESTDGLGSALSHISSSDVISRLQEAGSEAYLVRGYGLMNPPLEERAAVIALLYEASGRFDAAAANLSLPEIANHRSRLFWVVVAVTLISIVVVALLFVLLSHMAH